MTPSAEQKRIANEAIDIARKLFLEGASNELTAKGDRDYATETDFAIEEAVRGHLAEVAPEVGFFGEETGTSDPVDDLWWCLDPIDGTVNYAQGSPLCGISLALMAGNEPILGIVDLPCFGSRYQAAKGQGSTFNGETIRVRDVERLENAVVSIGDYAVGERATERNEARLGLTAKLAASALRVRMFGSAAIDLVWVADGTTAASITLSNNSWDVSAGVLIAKEAGAEVYDIDGSSHSLDSEATIASSRSAKETILRLL